MDTPYELPCVCKKNPARPARPAQPRMPVKVPSGRMVEIFTEIDGIFIEKKQFIPKKGTKKSHPKLRAAIKAGVRAAAKEPAATGLRRTPGGCF